MKKLLPVVLSFLSLCSLAQPAANSWINYNQEYFQLKIATDGVYRIQYQDLAGMGIPLSTINPAMFQVFSRGREIPIYVQGESDGVFNTTDFIEFYAKKNRGEYDSILYQGLSNQPNPYYSLFSDTISYYLTWNSSLTNMRFSQENAVDFGNYFPANFLWKEEIYSFSNQYYNGETFVSNSTDPDYAASEGWMDNALSVGQTRSYSLNFNNRYSSGPFVEMELVYAGESNWAGVSNGDHHVQIEVAGLIQDDIFEGYLLRKQELSFSPSSVLSGQNNLYYRSINDRNADVDRTALSYIKYIYPHNLALDNVSYFEFLLDDNLSQQKQYVELINFNGAAEPIFYDLTNHKRIRTIKTLNTYRVLVPNGSARKRCLVLNSNEVLAAQLYKISPNNKFSDYQNMAPDSAYLMVYHPSILPEVTRYAAFRSSVGYRPLLLNIEQLYHQYGYGISKNPLAIRNFVDEALKNLNSKPQYLFLLGKSVNQYTARKNASANAENLVPSYGNPSTDVLLTAGLDQTFLEAALPTGRISASSNAELGDYLDKVLEYENAPTDLWMKSVLHFAGGLSLGETNRFVGYLNNYQLAVEGPPFGGKALIFKKSTSIPIQTSLSDSIRSLINKGASLMTFFGHAAATGGFDISIDSPDKLSNRGKYPVILANSCFSGNYHQAGILSVAEQYVLEKNKGAIAFIASGSLGFANTLNIYSNALYLNFARNMYGSSLSECMIQTVKDIQLTNPLIDLRFVSLEMSLQGDPAIKMNPMGLPDYEITTSAYSTEPAQLDTELDSFKLKLKIGNLGRANTDTVLLQITRKYPQGSPSDTTYLRLLPNLFYERTLQLTLPIDRLKGIGNNQFSVIVDPNNEIAESNVLNNRIDFDLLIRAGDVIPIYPYDFSLVGKQNVELKASTAFAFEKELLYQFELDTNASFGSPALQTTTILSTGGTISWTPPLLQTMPDSAVYFWRVSKVPAAGQLTNWRQSSFQYIPNQTGWAQAHFDQFKSNNLLFMKANALNKQFEFVDDVKELYVKNIGNPGLAQNNDIRYAVDADTRERSACGAAPGFLIAILDSLSLDSWETPYGGLNQNRYYGQANADDYCAPNRTRPEKYFLFRQADTAQMFAMRDFLNQVVPNGNYVLVYSWQSVDYSSIWAMDSSILRSFENLGSSMVSQLAAGIPYIFLVQKGKLGTVGEVMGTNQNDIIEIQRTITVSADFGELNSPSISYSPNWERLAYRLKKLESNSQDQVELRLFGEKANGTKELAATFTRFWVDSTLLNLVNNKGYQELQLEMELSDPLNQSPPQLQWWQIIGDELPDVALSPNIYFKTNADTLQEGEDFEFEVAVKNISQRDMDSLSIRYSIINAQNQQVNINYPRQQPILADSMFISKLKLSTRNLLGKNTLLVELNPNAEQKEQHRFNNLGQYEFVVSGDALNPLIDVTFDGRHILNREMISSKPEILIQLQDDNNYLALDDTSVFSIFLRHPNGQEELLNFGSSSGEQMEFIPASLPENKALARINPDLREDGIYALRIQAFDKSGNSAGSQDYSLEFEVMNKSSITHMVNYPNPFSTSTRFVFTLTGSQIPDQIQIQILTVTGKVIREIDQFELGPIHIGNNITQFAWDGKDEFGDQLANGIYLYRVKANIAGSSIERRGSKADQFFVKNFGKMYLLR